MKRPLLLGHRGARASQHIPENTLESFELCLRQGCDGFEFDVRRSVDGQAVICHDPEIRGMEIAATSSETLGIPTLGEVLRSFSERAFLDIELKVGGLEQQTIALLQEYAPQKGYVVSSFLPQVLATLHRLDARIPLGFICDQVAEMENWKQLPVAWVIPQVDLADRAMVGRLHDAGKKVVVWTVNAEERMTQFAELGVFAVISDQTELAARVLGTY